MKPSVPAPPTHLDEVARAEWLRVAPLLLARRTFAEADHTQLELYVSIYAQWRRVEAAVRTAPLTILGPNGMERVHPTRAEFARLSDTLRHHMAALGLTPSSRAKAQALPDDGPDPLDTF